MLEVPAHRSRGEDYRNKALPCCYSSFVFWWQSEFHGVGNIKSYAFDLPQRHQSWCETPGEGRIRHSQNRPDQRVAASRVGADGGGYELPFSIRLQTIWRRTLRE